MEASGDDVPSYSFTDVQDPEAYYYGAVYYLVDLGVTTGYTESEKAGSFGVGDRITFEQLCTILARLLSGDEAVASGEYDDSALDSFADGDSVSAWARSGVAWCIDNGLIRGTDDGDGMLTLTPQDTIYRPRFAMFVYNWVLADVM